MRKISILLCLAILVFASCENENMTQDDIIQENSNRTGILDIVIESGHSELGGGILVVVLEQGQRREPGAYLTYNCDEPVHFQIDSQEPCDILDVDSETGRLSLLDGAISSNGLCGNYDDAKLIIEYSVTNVGGEIERYSFILSYEDFIILDLEED